MSDEFLAMLLTSVTLSIDYVTVDHTLLIVQPPSLLSTVYIYYTYTRRVIPLL